MENQDDVRQEDGSQEIDATPRRRGRWLLLWSTIGLLGLGGVLYGVDLAMSEGKVPRGVTVGGVDIGGMAYEQAEQRLRLDLGDSSRETVTITAGNMSTQIKPTQSGLGVDWAATVDQAGQQPMNPIERIQSFFNTREVGIVTKATGENLNRAISRATRELTREPSDANVAISPEGTADITEGVDGQTVDPAELREAVSMGWLNTAHRVNLKAQIVEPAVTTKDAQAVASDIIEPATSAPLEFKGKNNVNALINPKDMASIISFTRDGDGFVTTWDTEAAKAVLEPQLASTVKEFKNASFKFSGENIRVIPHQDGTVIDWNNTIGDLRGKFLNVDERSYDVDYVEKKAEYTTSQAEKAHFNDVVGEFTTGGFSDASGVNIRRVAAMVDGAVVLPGETFSLNAHTGPRGVAQGFVESGIIQDGRAGTAVGGGISQFATTLYNASYFAGMEDVIHTPHSYYISRYPAGREATVFEGAIDLQFKNPFDTPVLIRSTAGTSSVTVEMKGVKQVDVESIQGPKTNPTSPERKTVDAEDCSPSSGAPGFTITDTRVIRNLEGKELSRETQTTVYDPQPIVTCVPSAPRAAAVPSSAAPSASSSTPAEPSTTTSVTATVSPSSTPPSEPEEE